MRGLANGQEGTWGLKGLVSMGSMLSMPSWLFSGPGWLPNPRFWIEC